MVSRCVAILALAVAGQAVNLEHKNVLTSPKSAFGQTVLAQLQNKISEGSPASELNSIIEEIRGRLNSAQASDQVQSDEYARQCVAEDQQLDVDIANKKQDIVNKLDQISDKEAQIRTLTDEIAAYADKIIRDQKVIEDVNDEMSRNADEWALDQALFKNRTDDTNICIEAIQEIRSLDLGKLKAGQEDDSTDYKGASQDIYSEKYGSLLEKLSQKVHDASVLAFIQTTALAMSQMSKGDIDDLEKLLTKLENDLKSYLVELKNDNAKNKLAFEQKVSALNAELADATATKLADIKTKQKKEAQKALAQARLKTLDSELVDEKNLLKGLENEKVATAQKCTDLQKSFEARSGERSEELTTLQQIEAIIAEKLGGMQSHITDNINVGN